jgi:DnaA family protein
LKQLVLDIAPPPAPSFANFVPGRNIELLNTLQALAAGEGEAFVYLWGGAGSGRSHLLAAVLAASQHSGRRAAHFEPAAAFDIAENTLVVVDDAHRLDAAAQIALFNLHNRLSARKSAGGGLLVAGDVAPAQLALRDDLKTRLALGLVYQVHALDDDEKAAALAQHARDRGFQLSQDVSDYLLRHTRRDMPSLLALLDALDHYSLAAKRAITVPLLKELLKD